MGRSNNRNDKAIFVCIFVERPSKLWDSSSRKVNPCQDGTILVANRLLLKATSKILSVRTYYVALWPPHGRCFRVTPKHGKRELQATQIHVNNENETKNNNYERRDSSYEVLFRCSSLALVLFYIPLPSIYWLHLQYRYCHQKSTCSSPRVVKTYENDIRRGKGSIYWLL
jgi:hypothetical protein